MRHISEIIPEVLYRILDRHDERKDADAARQADVIRRRQETRRINRQRKEPAMK